jgi:UDP-glucuronate 4-epimerase
MKILVTGAAGFIGFHLTDYLLRQGETVVGIDNLNNYYDVSLKQARLEQLQPNKLFTFAHLELADQQGIDKLFREHEFDAVVNLAAQAGVRYSLKNPHAYINSNIVGFTNILESCRHHQVKHLVFASSSSVYGANTKVPFSTHDNVDHPISLYAATKKANELMAHTYSHLYGLPTTGLRFFTVYGPWGRPDMALFLFTKAILSGEPIEVFNYGKMKRDFTYIDDIVEGIVRVINNIPQGNTNPVELSRFIEVIEECLGIKAKKNMLPLQPGDVTMTYADVDDLIQDVGFKPATPIEVGVKRFVEWYRDYYQV